MNTTPPNEILERLKNSDSSAVHEAFIEFIQVFFSPVFGSIPKREIEIEVFAKLQKLGAIDKVPDLYHLVSQLRITRSKARNLLYESNLRQLTIEQLDYELFQLLKKPVFFTHGDKQIGIEVQNPLLQDHIKYKLKIFGQITDGSFSPDIIKLNETAFVDLFDSYLPEESKAVIKEALVKAGARSELSFKGVMVGAMKAAGKIVASEAGEELGAQLGEFIAPLISSTSIRISDKFKNLYKSDI
jgi:hypothetical protein